MFSVQHSFFRGKTSWLLVQKSSCLSRPPKVWCGGRALSRWDLKKTMALPKDQLENHLHHVEIYGSLFLTLVHIDAFNFFLSDQFVQANTQMTTKRNFMKWSGLPKDRVSPKISWKIIFIMSKSMAASFSLWHTLMHFCFFPSGICLTVCATPITVMGSVMGVFYCAMAAIK